MKAIIIALLATSALCQAEEKIVRVEVFDGKKVLVGKLGKPFGTIVRVACRSFVPPKGEPRPKAEEPEKLVEIIAVEGKRLETPVVMEWSAFMTATVEKPAVGETREIWGYETGGFEGTPPGAFEHVPSVADTGFAFVSRFVVLKKVEPEEKPK